MIKNISGIMQYQVVMKSADLLEVNLITNPDFKEDYKKLISETLKEYLPAYLKYNLVFNRPVVMSKNNKFKLFVDLSSEKNN